MPQGWLRRAQSILFVPMSTLAVDAPAKLKVRSAALLNNDHIPLSALYKDGWRRTHDERLSTLLLASDQRVTLT
jgi:hypothetical protein